MSEELRHGFRLLRSREFPEYQATARLYVHEKHGCQFLDMETKDTNNTFSTTIRSICYDDSGSTHVLEHMVLHGSKKYPINDVFKELEKRSMASYMNAETFFDWTQYLFSTKNETDLHNILDVYLDAIFHPNLGENNFLAECHHLEPTNPDDINSPLKHCGVVYNEMTGVLNDGDELYDEKLRAALLPDTPYKYIFGGYPPAIAKMTLDELKRQHKRYYAPSNALFFHYGSFDIDKIFEHVNSFLEKIDRVDIDFPVECLKQPKWDEPRRIECEGPMDAMGDENKQIRSTIAWLVGDIRDEELAYDLILIDSLLSETCATPLYQRLLKSQLATDFLSNGPDASAKNMTFSIGVNGLDEEGVDTFFNIVMSTLEEIVKEGFDPERVESALHSLEITSRRVSGNIGKNIISSTINEWVHGLDPFHVIDYGANLDALRERVHRPRYLESVVQKYLIDNKSRLHFIMRPVKGYTEMQSKEQQRELDEETKKMTKEEKEKIFAKAKELKEHFNEPKPLHLLPSIKVSDIAKVPQIIEYTHNNDVYVFPATTNGIIYCKLRCEVNTNNKILENIQLLSNVLCSIGAGDMDDEMFSVQEDLYTGGVTASLTIDTNADSLEDEPKLYMIIEFSCLHRNIKNAVDLVRKVVFEPMLSNKEQVITLTNMLASEYNDSVFSDGITYSMRYAAASQRRTQAITELTKGITFYKYVNELIEDEAWDDISDYIKECYDELFRKGKFDCAINCEPSIVKEIEPLIASLVADLNKGTDVEALASENRYDFIDEFMAQVNEQPNVLFEIDTSTNCTSVARQAPLFNDDLVFATSVLAYLYEDEFFFVDVREKLNAYGSYCNYKSGPGSIIFSSFRDTNCSGVIDAAQSALEKVANGELTDEMVERSIIRMFSSFDKPQAPCNKGLGFFLGNYNNEEHVRRRLKYLAVTKEDLIKAAKHLLEQRKTCAIVGNTSVSKPPESFVVDKIGE